MKESAKAIFALKNPSLPQPSKITLGLYGEEEKGKSIFLEEIDKNNFSKKELLIWMWLFLAGFEFLRKIEPQNLVPIANNDYQKAYNLGRWFLTEMAMDEGSLISLNFEEIPKKLKKNYEEKLDLLMQE